MAKRTNIKCKVLVFLSLAINSQLIAQEGSNSGFNTGIDFYSSYIFRGTRLGTGPAVQPVLEYASGPFTAGAWGSFDFRSYQETDLYLSFSLPAGFTIGITDYYLPDLNYFDYSRTTGSHAFELNLGFSTNNLNLSANYILNKAGGVGSIGNDLYFQAGYTFKTFSLFAGAGNGWHTYDPETGTSNFNICNIGIEVSKAIKVTDTFEIPLSGQLVFNPDKKQLFIVVGFTL